MTSPTAPTVQFDIRHEPEGWWEEAVSTEAEQRDRWLVALERLAAEIGGRRPKPWQLDLAARILARPPQRDWVAEVGIRIAAQTAAAALVEAMKADGRLNQWGNWPDPEEKP